MGLTDRVRITGWVVVLVALAGVVFSAPNQPAAHLGFVHSEVEAGGVHSHADTLAVVEAPADDHLTPEDVEATEVPWLPDGHGSHSHGAHADDGAGVGGPPLWAPSDPVGSSRGDGGVRLRQRELMARPG